MGFLIGLSASSLVSQFFEARSIRNIWGLTSKKTVVDKDTFSNLEWIISMVVGFVVFEIITKVVKEKIQAHFPKVKFRMYRWIISKRLRNELDILPKYLATRRIALVAYTRTAIRQTFSKYSKR